MLQLAAYQNKKTFVFAIRCFALGFFVFVHKKSSTVHSKDLLLPHKPSGNGLPDSM